MDYRVIESLRAKRHSPIAPKHGEVKEEQLKKSDPLKTFYLSIVVFIFTFLATFTKHYLFLQKHVDPDYRQGEYAFHILNYSLMPERTWVLLKYAASFGITLAVTALAIYLLFPVFKFFILLILERRIPTRASLNNFTKSHRVLSVFTLSAVIVYWFSNSAQLRDAIWTRGFLVAHWHLDSLILFAIGTVFVFVVLSLLILWKIPKNASKVKPGIFANLKKHPFALYLGTSTGLLIERKHKSGIAKNHPVILSLKDAILNLIIFGGLGAGKTSDLINPLLVQLIDDGYGGLIFDVKGSFQRTVLAIAAETGRSIELIGPTHQPMNLIAGLTPETAAEYVKAAILLDNPSKRNDAHWTEAATQLANSVLGLLHFLPSYYTLANMHRFIYDQKFREARQTELDDLSSTLDENGKRLLEYYRDHYENVFTGKYEKYQQSITGTLDKALSGFKHPKIEDAFCLTDNAVPEMDKTTKGKIYLLDMSLNDWGTSAKTVYMMIKLRFFSMVKQRQARPDWQFDNPKESPVFFLCDEYQELIDCSPNSLSDLSFWDKAKDAKCIGIISTQSIKSLYAKIGDRDAADTILQNFRQKLCLKTEDRATIEYFEYIAGKTEQAKRGFGTNEGKTKQDWKSSKHDSSSESLSFVDKSVIDAQLVRNLKPNEAIAMLIISGYSMDDVITLTDRVQV